ncbi:hypothetical protein ATE68_01055 [Sphingopyxis sp. H038]|uniref:DUF2339 domain-containing protein n=1 Tax=unclassified Sphingopyxis TaxID=2614943 RepID=UPI000731E044|nr:MULTISPECIES: DUF2339 domain-containing protein [unclassified Sphingopyxis]KTE10885.1 hypothetical protein ATE76_13285 [Sphingopyxis sp. H093]KTE13525.1 hypothetical protein ATE70_02370 [Sphingopyxis sp. H053]KTE25615.1 hypothetical protein ATE75_16010 [Sphingopyxis sp. H080]KTE36763.1 hypothetical protein ATE68_01055 [Sphingopyxis sp. H038]KTE47197.1 hypothetical protein ATE77_02370 [Sphingopyxis sp. H005]
MFDFLAFLAIIILFILLMDTRGRLKRAEATLLEAARRIGALQRGAAPPVTGDAAPEIAAVVGEAAVPVQRPPVVAADAAPVPARSADPIEAPKPISAPPLPAVAAAPAPKPLKAPAPAGPPVSLASRFENLFGKTLPIWAGGLTLAIAGVLIVRYAIDAGFFARIFTPGVQIVAGLLFGLGLIGGAEYAWRNEEKLRDVRVPQALSGAGIATLYAAIMVAANVYQLIGPLLAFLALALVTAAALGLSLRFGPPSALLGLAGGLAAPAMVGAVEPNVPLLAVYLALTIAGLAGVARARRWPWLALAALIGGIGWGLWMVLASAALDVVASVSIGGFVLLLAIVLPMMAFDGPRSTLLRTASAVVGALQLALLVGYGGFAPLHWGLFALIAAAGQWLAWRERGFAIVPAISLLLSLALLAAWPDPTPFWFGLIGMSLLVIHALPLLARMWALPKSLRPTLELCIIALAAAPLTKWHFWSVADGSLALVALGGALLAATAIGRGWRVEGRTSDGRIAWLTATVGVLLALAIILLIPAWLAPLGIAAVATSLLFFGKAALDARIERVAAGFVGAALVALVATSRALVELPRLIEGADGTDGMAIIRWAGLAAAALLFAVRADGAIVRRVGQIGAALFAYGAFAQVLPANALMLVPALGGAAVLLATRRILFSRIDGAAASLATLSLAWAALPMAIWSTKALLSLAGVPMQFDDTLLTIEPLLLRLLLPALLFAIPVWLIRDALPRWLWIAALSLAAIVGGVAVHSLYRIGFAAAAGGDFVTTGILQRLIWEAILIGAGWFAMARGLTGVARPLIVTGTAHALFYGLILHNPLWSAQAVGGWPLVNLLLPLFLLPWFGLTRMPALFAKAPAELDRAIQIVTMLLALGFAWATLRQLFHGSLLAQPGVTDAENILRSILILALALGFLLWGIRAKRHDWRIASLVLMIGAAGKVFLFDASGLEGLARIGSFVALGFSLIGIGWLYSRQLAPDRDDAAPASA